MQHKLCSNCFVYNNKLKSKKLHSQTCKQSATLQKQIEDLMGLNLKRY